MGGAASTQTLVRQELQKPLDGSDLSAETTNAEIVRLRKLLADLSQARGLRGTACDSKVSEQNDDHGMSKEGLAPLSEKHFSEDFPAPLLEGGTSGKGLASLSEEPISEGLAPLSKPSKEGLAPLSKGFAKKPRPKRKKGRLVRRQDTGINMSVVKAFGKKLLGKGRDVLAADREREKQAWDKLLAEHFTAIELESKHPHGEEDFLEKIQLQGATAIHIAFALESQLQAGSSLQLVSTHKSSKKSSDKKEKRRKTPKVIWETNKFTQGTWPNIHAPLVATGSRFQLKVTHPDASTAAVGPSAWGYKLIMWQTLLDDISESDEDISEKASKQPESRQEAVACNKPVVVSAGPQVADCIQGTYEDFNPPKMMVGKSTSGCAHSAGASGTCNPQVGTLPQEEMKIIDTEESKTVCSDLAEVSADTTAATASSAKAISSSSERAQDEESKTGATRAVPSCGKSAPILPGKLDPVHSLGLPPQSGVSHLFANYLWERLDLDSGGNLGFLKIKRGLSSLSRELCVDAPKLDRKLWEQATADWNGDEVLTEDRFHSMLSASTVA